MSEEENEMTAQDFLEVGPSPEDHICPKCGRDQKSDKPVAANEDEVKQYVRKLLAGETYEKSYSLYAGQVSVTFRSINTKDAQRMVGLLDQVHRTTNNFADNEKFLKIRLLFYLKQLQTKGYEMTEATTVEEAMSDFDDRFGSMNEDYIGVVLRSLLQFQNLMQLLADSGFDKDFWQGAGLD